MAMRILAVAALGALLVSGGPAAAGYAKAQELTILALRAARLAADHCPFAVDPAAERRALSRRGLSPADLVEGRFSPLLADDIAAEAQRYETDTASACDRAWASYGPDGPMRGLLRRR